MGVVPSLLTLEALVVVVLVLTVELLSKAEVILRPDEELVETSLMLVHLVVSDLIVVLATVLPSVVPALVPIIVVAVIELVLVPSEVPVVISVVVL